ETSRHHKRWLPKFINLSIIILCNEGFSINICTHPPPILEANHNNMKSSQAFNCFFFFFFLASLLLLQLSSLVTAQEVEDEREFDYIRGSGKGPDKWGELKKDWGDCKTGHLQSPIDMSDQRVKLLNRSLDINRHYKPANSTVKNRGHDISLQWKGSDAGSIRINGTEYLLQQCHWHSPSEHTINGRRFDMELHMVHLNPETKKIAVTGVLYQVGKPCEFLSKLINDVKSIEHDEMDKNHKKKELEKDMGVIDPREIRMGGKKYYRYIGSLTVPPCTEGVIWTINQKIKTVSRDQIKALRDAVHDYAEQNSRPVQDLHQREVQLYEPNQTSN
ncbi:Alpha carbonic anhydrase 4, partial [Linum grandiflorum]